MGEARDSSQPDLGEQVVALHAEGLLQPAIAARLGISPRSVSAILRAAGVRPRRGFAALSADERRRIASLGGKAAHAHGTAHEFTREEAVLAGAKGGKRAQRSGRAHRFTTETARAAGRKGGRRKAAGAKAAP
jgi:hypothetical protein